MEKRKIVKITKGKYESLKPSVFKEEQEEWERKGRVYDLKGLCSLLKNNQFEFEVSKEILSETEEYEIEQVEKHQDYVLSEGLEKKAESKTI